MAEKKNKEQYVRVEVIAQVFGVTVRRVQQLTQDGVIKTCQTAEGRRYELLPTIKTYIKYLSDKAHGRTRAGKEAELKEQKLEAEIALKESQGELHRLKTQIAAGEYISIDEVKLDYAKFFLVFKKFAMSIPARVCGMISGQLEPVEARRIEKEMAGEVAGLLASFVVAGVAEPDKIKVVLNDAEGKEMA